jgi:hypothetical protein
MGRKAMWVGALAVLAGAGCLSTTAPNNGDRTSAAVTGQVTRMDGVTGVGGALVAVQLLSEPVGGTQRFIAQGSVIADNSGRFLILFLLREPTGPARANLTATPAPGTGLLGRDTTAVAVKILLGDAPAESTHVQISLQPRP